MERPRVPVFQSTHFGIEVAFERVVEVDNLLEVGPAQLSNQRLHNLLTVLRPLLLQNILPNKLTDVSVEHNQSRVDGSRDTFAGLLDKFADVRQQSYRLGGDSKAGCKFLGPRLA
jgi:hypothetical protein